MGRKRTLEEKLEIIEYYKTHSNMEVYRHFHLGGPKFEKILKEFNIPMRSAEENKKLTCLHKFGTEYAAQSNVVKKHHEQTCLERYGVTNFAKSELFVEAQKAGCQEKYGVDNPMKCPEIRDKLVDSLSKRTVAEIEESNTKRKQTCLQRYGVEVPSQNERFKRKRKKTCLERYGVLNNSCLPEFHKTHRSRYTKDGFYFDSSYELIYYTYCKDNNIDIQVKPIGLEYEFENKKHFYYPDFLVEGKLIETKGSHFFDEKGDLINPYSNDEKYILQNLEKQKCMLKNDVCVISDEEMKIYQNYITETYKQKWYEWKDQFKVLKE